MKEEQSVNWYALYTKSKSEKKVNQRLLDLGFETYLPLRKQLKQWSDRRKLVEIPLINSYIFVRTLQSKLLDIVKVEGVSRYISFSGRPVVVRDVEIDMMKEFLSSNSEIEVIDGLVQIGKLVKIKKGIFKDYEGKILKLSGNRIAMEIESIGKSIIVSFDIKNL